jgi:hypothetical protein
MLNPASWALAINSAQEHRKYSLNSTTGLSTLHPLVNFFSTLHPTGDLLNTVAAFVASGEICFLCYITLQHRTELPFAT